MNITIQNSDTSNHDAGGSGLGITIEAITGIATMTKTFTTISSIEHTSNKKYHIFVIAAII